MSKLIIEGVFLGKLSVFLGNWVCFFGPTGSMGIMLMSNLRKRCCFGIQFTGTQLVASTPGGPSVQICPHLFVGDVLHVCMPQGKTKLHNYTHIMHITQLPLTYPLIDR